jgi:hypothetical protein
MDNDVLIQGSIHSNAQSKGKGMVVKIDMANAFDFSLHGFLFRIMERFGFNSPFIKWVATCIGNPWIAPLVNGRPSDFFQASKRLCQGCSLSPLIFIIVAKYLSIKLEQDRNIGNLLGPHITRGVKNMNHSQFVNDTLLLGGTSITIEARFKSTLHSFLDASRGDVDNRKCQVYGWNTSPRVM